MNGTEQDHSTPVLHPTEKPAAQLSSITGKSSRRVESDDASNLSSPSRRPASPTDDRSLILIEAATSMFTIPQEPTGDLNQLQHPETSSWLATNVPTQPLEPGQSSNGHSRSEDFSPAATTMTTQPPEPVQSLNALKRSEAFSQDTEEEWSFNEEDYNVDDLEEDYHTQTPAEITARVSEYLQIQEKRSKAIEAQKHLSVLRHGHVQELDKLAKQQTDQDVQLIQQYHDINRECYEAIQNDLKQSNCSNLVEEEEMHDKRQTEAKIRRARVKDSTRERKEEIGSKISDVQFKKTQSEKEMKSGHENIKDLNMKLRKLKDELGFNLDFALYYQEVIDQGNKRRRIE